MKERGGGVISYVQNYFLEFYAPPKTVLEMKQMFSNNDLVFIYLLLKIDFKKYDSKEERKSNV